VPLSSLSLSLTQRCRRSKVHLFQYFFLLHLILQRICSLYSSSSLLSLLASFSTDFSLRYIVQGSSPPQGLYRLAYALDVFARTTGLTLAVCFGSTHRQLGHVDVWRTRCSTPCVIIFPVDSFLILVSVVCVDNHGIFKGASHELKGFVSPCILPRDLALSPSGYPITVSGVS
jgi:hypothetical protein